MSSSQEQFSFWLGFSRGRADLPGLFSDSLENFFFLFLIHASAIDLSPGIVFAWSLLFLLAESCCKSPVLICATPIICCIMFPHWARVLILLCATRFFCPARLSPFRGLLSVFPQRQRFWFARLSALEALRLGLFCRCSVLFSNSQIAAISVLFSISWFDCSRAVLWFRFL
jgi:hypothetical protein